MPTKYAILIPASQRDDVIDTVDSVLFYEPDISIYVIKDYEGELTLPKQVNIIPPLPWKRNTYGGLLQKKLWALDFILENSDVEIVLFMDADALMIRNGVFAEMEQLFKLNTQFGAAGAHKVDRSGQLRDFKPIARSLVFRFLIASILFRKSARILRRLFLSASKNNYQLGEHALGCAVFLSRAMIIKWKHLGFLSPKGLEKLPVADDGLIGLLTLASGFQFAGIGGPNQLLNVAWIGLPSDPIDIFHSNTYITHSVRSYQHLTETEIRSFFKRNRI